MEDLIKTSLRQQAIYIPADQRGDGAAELSGHTALFAANLAQLGFGLDKPLLRALNSTPAHFQDNLLELLREVTGVNKNWTPLVKGWDRPTGESWVDHLITYFGNIFGARGTVLQCGHLIPDGTFPLERYNGCPFCGTPFEADEIEVMGQGSKQRLLRLWTEKEVERHFRDLLESKTALDATQMDSLKLLLAHLPMPGVKVGMKETLMAVIDTYVEQDREAEAGKLFRDPTDVLRYLWYKHTGFLQLVQPAVVLRRKSRNRRMAGRGDAQAGEALETAKADLKLKYDRRACMRVARWLNGLDLDPAKAAAIMHPKREMWVRFIRALRLVEYSRKPGLEGLKALVDTFHRQDYPVWQGRVDHFRLKKDEAETLALLRQRPGLFARCLFANMLWFGPDGPLKAFAEIIDRVPARLVLTLNMYAPNYFNRHQTRAVKPLGGNNKHIPPHPLVAGYTDRQLATMQSGVEDLAVLAMEKRFAAIPNENRSIFIHPDLFKMPVAISDRSESVQDLPVALMGTRFSLEGNKVRLFLQWGVGLPAQHLDMDLSCHVAYKDRHEVCSYYNLAPTGCKHSGDIRYIPDQVGTAEYIELDVDELSRAGARFVTFTCNAFSRGELSPNLVVGWMDSKHPMHLSEETGVAYDPSCVQHQVRITQSLTKGLVFGVLEVEKREIVWLEMAFGGQTVAQMDVRGAKALLARLDSKLSIGNLLMIKARAQGLQVLTEEDGGKADESYTMNWARDAAQVTRLLVD